MLMMETLTVDDEAGMLSLGRTGVGMLSLSLSMLMLMSSGMWMTRCQRSIQVTMMTTTEVDDLEEKRTTIVIPLLE